MSDEEAQEPASKRKMADRWTPKLARSGFCPVSSYFLANYHRLKPHPGAEGLSSTEAMVLIQILDFKWDSKMPFPTISTLATRMGLAPRTVRAAIARVEALGYVERVLAPNGGPNRYKFDGLFKALEAMYDQDLEAADDVAKAAK